MIFRGVFSMCAARKRFAVRETTFFALFESVDDFMRTLMLIEQQHGTLSAAQDREVRQHLRAARGRMANALEETRDEYHSYLDRKRAEMYDSEGNLRG